MVKWKRLCGSLVAAALYLCSGGCSPPEGEMKEEVSSPPAAASGETGPSTASSAGAGAISAEEAALLGDLTTTESAQGGGVHTDAVPDEGGMISGKSGLSAAPGLPEMGSKMSYIVRRGDSLSKIAKLIYGNVSQWRVLAQMSSLKDPNRIHPGDLLYYQLTERSVAFAKVYENAPREEVTVKRGETLSKLAHKLYQGRESWVFMWRQNGELGHPDRLQVGMRLSYLSLETLDGIGRTMSQLHEKTKFSSLTVSLKPQQGTLSGVLMGSSSGPLKKSKKSAVFPM